MIKKVVYGLLGILALGVLFFTFRFYSMVKESQNNADWELALIDGKLAPCGEKPNCVSSMSSDEQFGVEGFQFSNEPTSSFSQFVESLRQADGVELLRKTDNFAHLTYQSAIFGFTDDLQLLLAPDTGKVEVRSSSRVGYSDLGANRKRVEGIRNDFFSE
ncbi:MAG: DUF1499 domain-containing protein [Oligoflexales bacterium]|nr:DUF1499 domain-containing protein [Oligoflexales bacterium]